MALRPSILTLVGTAASGLLLAACGASGSASPSAISTTTPVVSAPGSTSASPPASPGKKGRAFNSCAVVTQSQAAAALGSSVSAGVLGNATVEGGLACVFYGPSAPADHNPNLAQTDTVRVVVVKGPSAQKWYKAYKSKVPFRRVSGFGPDAFYDGGASLSILKGSEYVRISVQPVGPPSLADEKKLAAAILPNI